ncbi:MAG: hypothetical protein ABI456_00565 [Ktedonobacteraceae bacterium]|nr:hypothetical protein [Chloroflexota bacterium]
MLDDIFEDSWAYQEIIEKGRQKGLEEGREEGRHEGLIQALLAIVETHFPTLMPQAASLVERVHDPLRLQHLIVLLTLAQSTEEAYDTLRTWSNSTNAL